MEDQLAHRAAERFTHQLFGLAYVERPSSSKRRKVKEKEKDTPHASPAPSPPPPPALVWDAPASPSAPFTHALLAAYALYHGTGGDRGKPAGMRGTNGSSSASSTPPLHDVLSSAATTVLHQSLNLYRRSRDDRRLLHRDAVTGNLHQDVLRCVVASLAVLYPDYWELLSQRFTTLRPRAPFIRCRADDHYNQAHEERNPHRPPAVDVAFVSVLLRDTVGDLKHGGEALRSLVTDRRFCTLPQQEQRHVKKKTNRQQLEIASPSTSTAVASPPPPPTPPPSSESVLVGPMALILASAVVFRVMTEQEQQRLPAMCAPPQSATAKLREGQQVLRLSRKRKLEDVEQIAPLLQAALLQRLEDDDVLGVAAGSASENGAEASTAGAGDEEEQEQRMRSGKVAAVSDRQLLRECAARTASYSALEVAAQVVLTSSAIRRSRAVALLLSPAHFFLVRCDYALHHGHAAVAQSDATYKDHRLEEPQRSVLSPVLGGRESEDGVERSLLGAPLTPSLLTSSFLYERLLIVALWTALYADVCLNEWVQAGGEEEAEAAPVADGLDLMGLLSLSSSLFLSTEVGEESPVQLQLQRQQLVETRREGRRSGSRPTTTTAEITTTAAADLSTTPTTGTSSFPLSPAVLAAGLSILQHSPHFTEFCCPVCDTTAGELPAAPQPMAWYALRQGHLEFIQKLRSYVGQSVPAAAAAAGGSDPNEEDDAELNYDGALLKARWKIGDEEKVVDEPPVQQEEQQIPLTEATADSKLDVELDGDTISSSPSLTGVALASSLLIPLAFSNEDVLPEAWLTPASKSVAAAHGPLDGAKGGGTFRPERLLPAHREEEKAMTAWWDSRTRTPPHQKASAEHERALLAECLAVRLQGLVCLIEGGLLTSDSPDKLGISPVLEAALRALQGLSLWEVVTEVWLGGLPLAYCAQFLLLTPGRPAVEQSPPPAVPREELEEQRDDLLQLLRSLIPFPRPSSAPQISSRSARHHSAVPSSAAAAAYAAAAGLRWTGVYPLITPRHGLLECAICFSLFHQRCIFPAQHVVLPLATCRSAAFLCHSCRLRLAEDTDSLFMAPERVTLGLAVKSMALQQ